MDFVFLLEIHTDAHVHLHIPELLVNNRILVYQILAKMEDNPRFKEVRVFAHAQSAIREHVVKTKIPVYQTHA